MTEIQPQVLKNPVTPSDLVGSDNWVNRRRCLFVSLAFIGAMIAYGSILGKDTAINVQTTVSLIAAGTSLLTAYIFGAVWDDHNKRMFFKGKGGPDDCAGQDQKG